MANKLVCLMLVGVLLAIANVTATSIPPTIPESTGAAAHRSLLMGPADAFNRASRPHMAGKETGGPSKAVGIEPEPAPAPAPAPVPAPEQPVQPASPAVAAIAATQPSPSATPDMAKDAPDTATKPTKPLNNKVARVHRHSHKTPKPAAAAAAATAASTAAVTAAATQPAAAAATQQQRNLLGGPADIFNRATHARHATKEAAGLSKATGVNTPPQPQQQPSSTKPLAVTEPGSRNRHLLQYGWSGSSASASASASAGSGGWGGDSWAGAQAQAQSQSQSFGGGFDNGFGGYGFGRKLRAAARN